MVGEVKLTRRRRQPPQPPGPERPFGAAATDTDYGLLVTVTGEIDIATTPRLREVLTKRPERGDLVVVDLTAVTFMDSSALGAILKLHTALIDERRRLAVVCPPGPARLLFEVTGLDSELPLFDSLEAATRS